MGIKWKLNTHLSSGAAHALLVATRIVTRGKLDKTLPISSWMRHAAKILIAQRQKVAHGRAPIPTKIILCRRTSVRWKQHLVEQKPFSPRKTQDGTFSLNLNSKRLILGFSIVKFSKCFLEKLVHTKFKLIIRQHLKSIVLKDLILNS
jgi:hypothetical protein